MRIEDIRPFVRFARYLTLDEKSSYPTWIPLDARLFYTVSGNGEISVGKISFSMSHGVCLILPSGTEYRLETPTKSVTYLALNFDFNADLGSTVTVPVHPVAKSEYSDSLLTDRTEIDGTDVFSSPLCIENLLLENELIEIELENDVVKIDGNFAIAWSNTLQFTVERSSKTLIGSAASGEGLVNVYRGTGRVLMAPVG